MKVSIDLQIATEETLKDYPSLEKMELWAQTALTEVVVLKIVNLLSEWWIVRKFTS